MKVRTRYAPSPTGFQHIGGLRTALYAYLFAKKQEGTLVLRIEDTDQKRFVEGTEEYIIECLNYLSIKPDEGVSYGGDFGPYRQSDRKDIYPEYAQQLLDSGNAYYAFDTPDELDAMRKRLQASGSSIQQYNAITRGEMKNSLTVSAEETKSFLDSGKYVVRFKLPENETVFVKDEVRGTVEFNTNQLDDKVLFKSDGMPTYHLANVVDDHLMEITHVIRGEEWLPSTPLHVLLYKAFGWDDEMPSFAHLPLMLNPDGKGKLSKRTGDKLGFPVFPLAFDHPTTDQSSNGYREMGFIPDAFTNFLAFQGWNPGDDKEILDREQLIANFSLERVTKAGVRFDFSKAQWYNEEYLRAMDNEDLADLIIRSKPEGYEVSRENLIALTEMMKARMTFPQDFWEQAKYFFSTPSEYDGKTVRSKWKEENKEHLKTLCDKIVNLDSFKAENIETCIKGFIEEHGLSFGNILLPVRLMLTGVKGGPSVFEIAEILGKEEVAKRFESAQKTFDEMQAAV